MWDFDGDELVFFVVAGIITVLFGGKYFFELLKVSPLVSPLRNRGALLLLPFVCLLVILVVLWSWSDAQTVRGHADYMTMFMAGGGAWVFGSVFKVRLFGISVRDDAVERRNGAAAIVAGGAMVGNTLCYAGSNIGSGPTIWTTIVPAIVASGILSVLWMLIELSTRVSETITIERDVREAWLLAGFLVLAGLNLGWAGAGDFRDWASTMQDFLQRGWPTVPLAFGCALGVRTWKPQCKHVPERN
jgi:hypothetical protein